MSTNYASKFDEYRMSTNYYAYDVEQFDEAKPFIVWNPNHKTYLSFTLLNDMMYEVREDFIDDVHKVYVYRYARYIKSINDFKSYKQQVQVVDENLKAEILNLKRYYYRKIK